MFADEEAGGRYGARWAVDHRPELFEGATEAISEVGGFSVDVAGRRAYLLQTAEKGLSWLRLVAEGRAGHGSQVNTDNAVTHLAEAVARHRPARVAAASSRPTVRALLEGVADLTGLPFDPEDPERSTRWSPRSARRAVRRRDAAPHHEPDPADGGLQGERHPRRGRGRGRRPLPAGPRGRSSARRSPRSPARTCARGHPPRHRARGAVRGRAGRRDGRRAARRGPGAPRCCRTRCRAARTTSRCRAWASPATASRRCGCRADLDFAGMFHGVDERVPIDALRFGTRVLDRLLRPASSFRSFVVRTPAHRRS